MARLRLLLLALDLCRYVDHVLQFLDRHAQHDWVCHVGLCQLLVGTDALFRVLFPLIISGALRSMALAQLSELSRVLNRLIEVTQQVVDQTDLLVAIRLTFFVVCSLCNVLAFFKVLQCLTEIADLLVFVGDRSVHLYDFSRDVLN